jgi:hypothetical protein
MAESGNESDQQLIEYVAERISGWKLALPAIVFLEILKPFSFFASQGLLLCQPLLEFFFQGPRIAGYADLLADRTNVERLVTRLEQDGMGHTSERKEREG